MILLRFYYDCISFICDTSEKLNTFFFLGQHLKNTDHYILCYENIANFNYLFKNIRMAFIIFISFMLAYYVSFAEATIR